MFKYWVKNVYTLFIEQSIVGVNYSPYGNQFIKNFLKEDVKVVKSTLFNTPLSSIVSPLFLVIFKVLNVSLYPFSTVPTITRTNKIFKISNNKGMGVF